MLRFFLKVMTNLSFLPRKLSNELATSVEKTYYYC